MTRIQLSALKGHLSFRKLSCQPPSWCLFFFTLTLKHTQTHRTQQANPPQSLTLTFFSGWWRSLLIGNGCNAISITTVWAHKKSVTSSQSMKFDLCHYAYTTSRAQLCILYSFSHPLFAFVMLKSVTDIFSTIRSFFIRKTLLFFAVIVLTFIVMPDRY